MLVVVAMSKLLSPPLTSYEKKAGVKLPTVSMLKLISQGNEPGFIHRSRERSVYEGEYLGVLQVHQTHGEVEGIDRSGGIDGTGAAGRLADQNGGGSPENYDESI